MANSSRRDPCVYVPKLYVSRALALIDGRHLVGYLRVRVREDERERVG
jgi:hypothetical protein